jgi:hypothetical protein
VIEMIRILKFRRTISSLHGAPPQTSTSSMLKFNQSAAQLPLLAKELIQKHKELHDRIASSSTGTFENTIIPLGSSENTDPSGEWMFLKDTHPNKEVPF